MISRKEYKDLIRKNDLGEILTKEQIGSIIDFEFVRNIPKTINSPADQVELLCPYCKGRVFLKDSSIIYNGRSYGMVWVYENYPECDSYVGAHKKTSMPKGTLANADLRFLRIKCHDIFDKLWRTGRINRIYPEHIPNISNRKRAYLWLSKIMNVEEAHIGEFNIEQCEKLFNAIH